jgi:hypothetical protein
MPPAPDVRVKITEAYARHVACDAFFWAWPLVNVFNKRRGAEQSKELAYAGPVPAAPLNRIVMLTDYVAPRGTHRRLSEPGCGLWRRRARLRSLGGRDPGTPLMQVQYVLGHASIQTTANYIHTSKQKAASDAAKI